MVVVVMMVMVMMTVVEVMLAGIEIEVMDSARGTGN